MNEIYFLFGFKFLTALLYILSTTATVTVDLLLPPDSHQYILELQTDLFGEFLIMLLCSAAKNIKSFGILFWQPTFYKGADYIAL